MSRRYNRRAFAGLARALAAGVVLPSVGGQRAPKASTAHGLRCVRECTATSSFHPLTFRNSAIVGVSMRIAWSDLQSSATTYNWRVIDAVFERARRTARAVTLLITPGFGSPAWALQGAVVGNFPVQGQRNQGKVLPLPVPWDPVYQNNWFTFVQALAARYASDPQLVSVAVAGPTSVSDEMSLPSEPNALALWQSLGYRPSLYLAAWQRTFQLYDALFPTQYISLALFPGLPINEAGQIDHNQMAVTRGDVLSAALVYRSHFSLQESGLNARGRPGAGYAIVQRHSGQCLTGFQMSTSATKHPREMGNATDAVDALYLSINVGVAAQINFLEVYEDDVLNTTSVGTTSPVVGQTMQNVLASVNANHGLL